MQPETIEYKYIKFQGDLYLKVDEVPVKDIDDVLYGPDVEITEEGKQLQLKKSARRISKIISGQTNTI